MFVSPNNQKGFSLVEVVVAISIILVFLTALVGTYNVYLRVALQNSDTAKAAYLAEEGIEAIKLLRDTSWDEKIATLSTNTPYYLVFSGGTWQTSVSETYIDSLFLRSITIGDVYRDSESDIVTSGGTLDGNAKQITVTVAWHYRGATTTKEMSTYITNLFRN